MQVLRVAASSRPKSVAGAVAAIVREEGAVELQAVGAGAVNQAVKAVAIARTYLSGEAVDLAVVPEIFETAIGGETRTAVRFTVEPR
ncbi:MAG: stage V sporulation protein S [Firmicutes bacterium]|nr:stage V sporulation protein S [Bacillota bacterium]